MAPNLLFHPALNEAEALAGISHRKVSHPTAKHWIDQLNDPIHWLRLVAAEHSLELPQQCRSFLELRRVLNAPCAPSTTDAAKIEPQKAEALATAEVYDSTLLFIDFDSYSDQFLAKAFLYSWQQPIMSTVCVDQDHEIVSKTRILDPYVLAVACGLLCSLKHTVHLIEVDITEQWRDDAQNAKDNFGS